MHTTVADAGSPRGPDDVAGAAVHAGSPRGAAEARTEVACAHCGLTVASGLVVPGAPRQFCCAGCRAAHAIIHGSGLARYYRLPERRGVPVRASGRRFEEFDHPSFHESHVRRHAPGLAETDLYLEGVHCASCVWLIERVPRVVAGVASAELDVPRSVVRIVWDDGRVRLSRIGRFLDMLGYPPHPCRGARVEALRRAEDRAMIARIGVAAALAGNVMLLALALYSGWLTGIEREYERYFRWISLLLTAPALFGPGWIFFRGAWAALRTRALHMDLPIALALGAGFARGAVNVFATARGPIYFDGVTGLIFLLLVGRFLQQRAQRAAIGSTELMSSLAPSTARVLVPGEGVREVPAEALLPGMTLEARAGDVIAADGMVLEGRSEVDTALLTGESRLAAVGPGEWVFAGTVNRSARLELRVEQTRESSRLGRILREVESAARRRAPVVRLADRLAGGFVAVVLALAAAAGLAWWRLDPSRALDIAIALLVVTCPCALALATPLAITVAIGRAARAGILIKGGDALEALGRPGFLYLDKTGTVTHGRTSLTAWEGPESVKALVLAVERHSTHPIARGFQDAWPDLPVPGATEAVHSAGGGVEGLVGGRRVVVGSPGFVRARVPGGGTPGTGEDPAGAVPPGDGAWTPVLVAVDGRVAARAAFDDPIRADAAAAIICLRVRGWRVRLLSGDDEAVVAAVGDRLAIGPADRRGGASPEEKLRIVEAAARAGPTVMVGDGVNDAAAIARATVGVGVHGGAEACIAAADVFLARPGLGSLVALVDGAERTLRVIRRNLAFSLAYNVVGATLAVSGVIHPLIAAVLMPLSSLTVILGSWLGRTYQTDAT